MHYQLSNSISRIALGLVLFAGVATVAAAQCSQPGDPAVTKATMAVGSFARLNGTGDAVPIQTDFKIKVKDGNEEVILDPDSQQNILVKLCVKPNGIIGWHTHPGPAIVTIQSGALSLYDSDDPTCSSENYRSQMSFVDKGHGHVHFARNEGRTDTEIWVLFIDVPAGVQPLLPAPNPGNCAGKGF